MKNYLGFFLVLFLAYGVYAMDSTEDNLMGSPAQTNYVAQSLDYLKYLALGPTPFEFRYSYDWVDADTKKFVRDVLREMNICEEKIKNIKIRQSLNNEFSSSERLLFVPLNSEIIKNNKSLHNEWKGAISHEMGHVEHGDWIYGDLPKVVPFLAKYREYRADSYALAHMKNQYVLHAVAQHFERHHEDCVKDISPLSKKLCNSVPVLDELLVPEYRHHPSSRARAQRYAYAAQALEKNSSSIDNLD